MAYGGGGFAISYPLAKVLEKMQDRCIERYSDLYGSDDRIHACMAELGVPLTKEVGFHQFDVYGRLLGLLSVHPQAPIVSIHHLDVVEPIFPKTDRVNAVKKLMIPAKLDSASLINEINPTIIISEKKEINGVIGEEKLKMEDSKSEKSKIFDSKSQRLYDGVLKKEANGCMLSLKPKDRTSTSQEQESPAMEKYDNKQRTEMTKSSTEKIELSNQFAALDTLDATG